MARGRRQEYEALVLDYTKRCITNSNHYQYRKYCKHIETIEIINAINAIPLEIMNLIVSL